MVKRYNWLRTKLESLKENVDQIANVDKGIYYEVGAWSALKLIFLMSYIYRTYTSIIPKIVNNWYYIDLLSGSGIGQLGKNKDLVYGSPFIAIAAARMPFSKMYFVEKNPNQARALKNRLESSFVKTNFKEINYDLYDGKDCNEAIEYILNDMSKRSYHYLAFIDNQGMDAGWSTMKKLLKRDYGDLIITYQTTEFFRTHGAALINPSYENTMNVFFGKGIWEEAQNKDDLLKRYMNKIRKYRDIVINIPVRKNPKVRFHYDIIFACRKTAEGNPWLKSVESFKDKIEHSTGDTVDNILDVLTGRVDTSFFFPDEGRKKEPIDQKSLFDF